MLHPNSQNHQPLLQHLVQLVIRCRLLLEAGLVICCAVLNKLTTMLEKHFCCIMLGLKVWKNKSRGETSKDQLKCSLIEKCWLKYFTKKSGLSALKETPNRATRFDALDDDTRELVAAICEREDNSRLATGRKDTRTKNKIKQQKRFLNDTMINLNEKYCTENNSNAVSYTTFTQLRLFWVCVPLTKDRETCRCVKGENILLKVEKLHQLQVLRTKYPEDILKQICCDNNSKKCMYRECDQCLDSSVEFASAGVADDDSVVVWSEWALEKKEYEKDGVERRKRLVWLQNQ